MNSLFMPLHRPQNRTTVDIEHLHDPFISTRDDKLPIFPNLYTPRCFLKPSNRLDDLARPWRIDQ
jgi:hypothetical protein